MQQTPSFVEISKPEAAPLPDPVIAEPETQPAAEILPNLTRKTGVF